MDISSYHARQHETSRHEGLERSSYQRTAAPIPL